MEEKTHTFKSFDGKIETIIEVKESELNQWQKDILLGSAIKAYDDLSEELKMKFIQYVNKSR